MKLCRKLNFNLRSPSLDWSQKRWWGKVSFSQSSQTCLTRATMSSGRCAGKQSSSRDICAEFHMHGVFSQVLQRKSIDRVRRWGPCAFEFFDGLGMLSTARSFKDTFRSACERATHVAGQPLGRVCFPHPCTACARRWNHTCSGPRIAVDRCSGWRMCCELVRNVTDISKRTARTGSQRRRQEACRVMRARVCEERANLV